MNKKVIIPGVIVLALMSGLVFNFIGSSDGEETTTRSSISEDHEHNDDGTHVHSDIGFIDGALVSSSEVSCILSGGSSAECDEITIAGLPADYEIGPFCPTTTSAPASEAGIWLDGDNLYDADGEFITNLAEIYGDDNWKLYNDDGTVNVTDTEEAFNAAARPDVDPDYQNYCVEGQIEWTESGGAVNETYIIPSNPVLSGSSTNISSKVGVTFGGVVIDPAAPVDAILGAYTIATFDDCGGHVNPVDGYHLHAATGCSEVGEAIEGETRAFAIAMDGFNIHSPYAAGEEPSDLDQCNGHTTDELGYHYHANSAESNGVLTCFMGELEESQASTAGGPGGPGGGPPTGGPR